MKPTLVFVHGAFSTSDAFNYFQAMFADYPQMTFTYDWNDYPSQIGEMLAESIRIEELKTPVVLLGHSLGGNVVINTLPHLEGMVSHVFTYASPLGGSPHALIAGLFSRAQVFSHILPTSSEIRLVKKTARHYSKLITSFVADRGPMSNNNDGVVTVASQRAVRGLKYIPVATNHMEVLLSNSVIDTTRKIIEQ